MADNLHNCGHITHLMTIICTFKVFSASCIRLFGRLSAIGVFNYFFAAAKKPCNRTWLQGFERTGCARFVLGAARRALRAWSYATPARPQRLH